VTVFNSTWNIGKGLLPTLFNPKCTHPFHNNSPHCCCWYTHYRIALVILCSLSQNQVQLLLTHHKDLEQHNNITKPKDNMTTCLVLHSELHNQHVPTSLAAVNSNLNNNGLLWSPQKLVNIKAKQGPEHLLTSIDAKTRLPMYISEHKPGACKLLQHEFKSNLGVYNSVSASTFNSHKCQKKSTNEEKNLV